MTEGDPKKQNDSTVSDFDRLLGGIKRITKRAQEEGRIVPKTPVIDRYIDKKKKQAGSPSTAFESEES